MIVPRATVFVVVPIVFALVAFFGALLSLRPVAAVRIGIVVVVVVGLSIHAIQERR